MTHCQQVKDRSLAIANRLNLSDSQKTFIQEAAMLHDIGITRTNTPNIFCTGEQHYLCHIQIGHHILIAERLPQHAQVALLHTGVGITRQDIIQNKIPLPIRDYIPETIEQRIIAYADSFFTKDPSRIHTPKTLVQVLEELEQYGQERPLIFKKWVSEFEPHLQIQSI